MNETKKETRKTLVIPNELHKKLKKRAVDNGTTLQEETRELIKEALKK